MREYSETEKDWLVAIKCLMAAAMKGSTKLMCLTGGESLGGLTGFVTWENGVLDYKMAREYKSEMVGKCEDCGKEATGCAGFDWIMYDYPKSLI